MKMPSGIAGLAQVRGGQAGAQGVAAVRRAVVPDDDQGLGMVSPQVLRERHRGRGGSVAVQVHGLHAGQQALDSSAFDHQPSAGSVVSCPEEWGCSRVGHHPPSHSGSRWSWPGTRVLWEHAVGYGRGGVRYVFPPRSDRSKVVVSGSYTSRQQRPGPGRGQAEPTPVPRNRLRTHTRRPARIYDDPHQPAGHAVALRGPHAPATGAAMPGVRRKSAARADATLSPYFLVSPTRRRNRLQPGADGRRC
jgi:hypothetical protein